MYFWRLKDLNWLIEDAIALPSVRKNDERLGVERQDPSIRYVI